MGVQPLVDVLEVEHLADGDVAQADARPEMQSRQLVPGPEDGRPQGARGHGPRHHLSDHRLHFLHRLPDGGAGQAGRLRDRHVLAVQEHMTLALARLLLGRRELMLTEPAAQDGIGVGGRGNGRAAGRRGLESDQRLSRRRDDVTELVREQGVSARRTRILPPLAQHDVRTEGESARPQLPRRSLCVGAIVKPHRVEADVEAVLEAPSHLRRERLPRPCHHRGYRRGQGRPA